MTLLDGITARVIETDRLGVGLIERAGDAASTPADRTVVFVHGGLSAASVWQQLLLDLPSDLRVIAVDLRGFGLTESLPVDATRGVADFADDLHAALSVLDLPAVHLVGWALGGAVVQQYALAHPVLSLTLQAPLPPYGFGGTRRDGSLLTADAAGTGAGTASPDLVERLIAGDDGDSAPTSPRSVFRTDVVAATGDFEDIAVTAMLTTSTAAGNYPGDVVPSENWPGFAPGDLGVLNAVAPGRLDLSGIVGLETKPPILWVRGTADAVVSDASFQDVSHLGALGVVAGWPGAETAPPQPMVSQTRDVLDAYAAAGGEVAELVLEGVGHAPHLEAPAAFRAALLGRIGYVGRPVDPAPPTETIILRSAD